MSQVQRTTGEPGVDPALQRETRRQYEAGGHVAVLQANLARQLHEQNSAGVAAVVSPVERLTQSCSRNGGYALLGVGYAITGVMILRWL